MHHIHAWGFHNSYGRHNAIRLEKSLFPCQGQQICKTVRNHVLIQITLPIVDYLCKLLCTDMGIKILSMRGIAIDTRYRWLNTHFGFLKLGHLLIPLTGFLQVNPDMVASLEKAGLSFAAKDETGERTEIVEVPSHPFFIGAQFHPEFKSRPGKVSPLFSGQSSCHGFKQNLQTFFLIKMFSNLNQITNLVSRTNSSIL